MILRGIRYFRIRSVSDFFIFLMFFVFLLFVFPYFCVLKNEYVLN